MIWHKRGETAWVTEGGQAKLAWHKGVAYGSHFGDRLPLVDGPDAAQAEAICTEDDRCNYCSGDIKRYAEQAVAVSQHNARLEATPLPTTERRSLPESIDPPDGTGVDHNVMAQLICEYGAMEMAKYVKSGFLLAAFRDGVHLLRWDVRVVGGAMIFFRLNNVRQRIISPEPRIMVVNAPENDRAKWQAVADGSPYTILLVMQQQPYNALRRGELVVK